MIDRRIIEPDAEQARIAGVSPDNRTFEGADAERRADAYQEQLRRHGVASSQFHERHVLLKESVCWIPGDQVKNV